MVPRILFLGTPSFAVHVLSHFLQSGLDVVGVVTKAPVVGPRHRSQNATPTEVFAKNQGIPVFTPNTASDPDFLKSLESLRPDIAVTAAYGLMLPTVFLQMFPRGVWNIHPSALPLYRGASPVQRALEAGDTTLSISLVQTVLAMDAGPILHQESVEFSPNAQSPEVLDRLFALGAQRFVERLPLIFENKAPLTPQNHDNATLARKLQKEESFLNFDTPAWILHNKVRAFVPWPGTWADVCVAHQTLRVKIIKTILNTEHSPHHLPHPHTSLAFEKGLLNIPCAQNTVLHVEKLQIPGRQVLTAGEFWNGVIQKSKGF